MYYRKHLQKCRNRPAGTRVVIAMMTRLALALMVTPALFAEADGTIIERKEAEFAAYGSVKGIDRYASAAQYATALEDDRFVLERVVYASDGLPVVAYVYGPREGDSGKGSVVVFVRGGYRDTDISLYASMMHRLARAGFVVVAPMLRGSEGAPGVDQLGGAELRDVMVAAGLPKTLGVGSPERLFLYGESRGGMMVYQAIRDGFPARAAAVVGAYTDQAEVLQTQPQFQPLAESLWGRTNWDAALERRSAIRWADRLKVPLLILHGSADKSISPSHALKLASRFQELGQPYQLIIYAGDNHVLTRHREQRERAVIGWFREHQ